MAISVTKFKNSCLELIRRVETTGKAVAITRRGKTVAQLAPPLASAGHSNAKPWEQLRSMGGRLHAKPHESVLREEDLKALR